MYSVAIKELKKSNVNDDEEGNDDVNNNKDKDDNNNVDNINGTILSNSNIKRKSDNLSYPVSNKKIKFVTKGKYKTLNDNNNDNDNDNDNESIEINESLFDSDSETTKKDECQDKFNILAAHSIIKINNDINSNNNVNKIIRNKITLNKVPKLISLKERNDTLFKILLSDLK